MTTKERSFTYKIGVRELLLLALPFELIFGTTSRALALVALAIIVHFARSFFQTDMWELSGRYSTTDNETKKGE